MLASLFDKGQFKPCFFVFTTSLLKFLELVLYIGWNIHPSFLELFQKTLQCIEIKLQYELII